MLDNLGFLFWCWATNLQFITAQNEYTSLLLSLIAARRSQDMETKAPHWAEVGGGTAVPTEVTVRRAVAAEDGGEALEVAVVPDTIGVLIGEAEVGQEAEGAWGKC